MNTVVVDNRKYGVKWARYVANLGKGKRNRLVTLCKIRELLPNDKVDISVGEVILSPKDQRDDVRARTESLKRALSRLDEDLATKIDQAVTIRRRELS